MKMHPKKVTDIADGYRLIADRLSLYRYNMSKAEIEKKKLNSPKFMTMRK